MFNSTIFTATESMGAVRVQIKLTNAIDEAWIRLIPNQTPQISCPQNLECRTMIF